MNMLWRQENMNSEEDTIRILKRDPYSNIARELNEKPWLRGLPIPEFEKWLATFGWTVVEFVAEYNKRVVED